MIRNVGIICNTLQYCSDRTIYSISKKMLFSMVNGPVVSEQTKARASTCIASVRWQ